MLCIRVRARVGVRKPDASPPAPQNIRKRLMDKMRAMEQSHLKQLQENSQFTGVPTSAGAATAAAAAAAATQQVAKVSTNLDTLHSGVRVVVFVRVCVYACVCFVGATAGQQVTCDVTYRCDTHSPRLPFSPL